MLAKILVNGTLEKIVAIITNTKHKAKPVNSKDLTINTATMYAIINKIFILASIL